MKKLAIAALFLAAPAFAHDHDGSKRLMRQMAMGEGDPQGLIAVPHSADVRAEQERIHGRLTKDERVSEEERSDGTTKRHHKED